MKQKQPSRWCSFGVHRWTKWDYDHRDAWNIFFGWQKMWSKQRHCADCGKTQTKQA